MAVNDAMRTTMPSRIQRSRAKGWLMPERAIYVGRPTRWGNPFVAHDWQAAFRAVALGCRGDRAGRNEAAVKLYRLWLTSEGTEVEIDRRDFWQREVMTVQTPPRPTIEDIRTALRGHDLACWCALDLPCHATVLIELANG
jgi:hypothetical protein